MSQPTLETVSAEALRTGRLPTWHGFYRVCLQGNPGVTAQEVKANFELLSALIKTQKAAQAPKPPDLSVLVHECFAQELGEEKPSDCGCARRISRLDAAALLRHGKADRLIYVQYGKPKTNRSSIVLRRAYVDYLRSKSTVDPAKLLPALLQSKVGSRLSFKKGVIRTKNGTPIQLEMNRTDYHYWHSVLASLGVAVDAGKFLENAAQGMSVPASYTTLENFVIAPVATVDGLDPEINAELAKSIYATREGVKNRRRKVGAAGFVKGSGGLTYNEFGEIKAAPAIHSVGNSRDSDERAFEQHSATGQYDSKQDRASAFDRCSDGRSLSKPLQTVDAAQLEMDGKELKPVYDVGAVRAKSELEALDERSDELT